MQNENQRNCMNNLQEKEKAIGEIDRHRLTDIICILTVSKIKVVEAVLPNVHLHSMTTVTKTTNGEIWVPANS